MNTLMTCHRVAQAQSRFGCRRAGSAGSSATADRPDVIARPPRIAYLLLAIGALLEWFRPLSLLPPGWSAALRYGLGGLLVVLGLAVVTVAEGRGPPGRQEREGPEPFEERPDGEQQVGDPRRPGDHVRAIRLLSLIHI